MMASSTPSTPNILPQFAAHQSDLSRNTAWLLVRDQPVLHEPHEGLAADLPRRVADHADGARHAEPLAALAAVAGEPPGPANAAAAFDPPRRPVAAVPWRSGQGQGHGHVVPVLWRHRPEVGHDPDIGPRDEPE